MVSIRRILLELVAAAVLTGVASLECRAEGSYFTYTPYSMFGVGDRISGGTAFNRGMGGVGVAMRDKHYINILNPASVTERDSLSFMADFSIYGENKLFRQNSMKSASNTFNLNDLVMSFPLGNRIAAMVGLIPYSSVGYGYSYNETNPITGTVSYSSVGQGSVYQAFAGVGTTFFKKLSIGADFIYYFGNLDKSYNQTFSEASFSGYTKGYMMQLSAVGGKFGIQYEQPLNSKSKLTIGVTHSLNSALNGYITDYSTSLTDTLKNYPDRIRFASETGVGICFKHNNNLTIEFDWLFSDWTGCGIADVSGFEGNKVKNVFSTTRQNDFRIGAEYIPNRADIRYYFKRCSYRAGAYFRNEYYLIDGNKVNSLGITLGMTLPVFRWSNGLSLGVELGRRGTMDNSLVKENYFNFTVGMNIFDIWFQQPRYE